LLGLISHLVVASAISTGGDHTVSLSGHYASVDSHGGGVALRYTLGLDDFWNFTTDVAWSGVPGTAAAEGTGEAPMQHVLTGSVGILYHLDAFEWVPYLVFAFEGTGALRDGEADREGLGLQLGGGIDYRGGPRWSVGLGGLWHRVIWGEAPTHTTWLARVNLHF
jgi:hypothetical protein